MTVEMSSMVSGSSSCTGTSPKVFASAGRNPTNLPLRKILKPGDPNYQGPHQTTAESSDSTVNPELLLTSPEMELTSPDMEAATSDDVTTKMGQLQISRESSPIPHLIICEEADNDDFLDDDDNDVDCEYGGYRESDAISVSECMEGASLSRSSSSLSVPPVDVIDEGKRPPHIEGEDGEPGTSWTPC